MYYSIHGYHIIQMFPKIQRDFSISNRHTFLTQISLSPNYPLSKLPIDFSYRYSGPPFYHYHHLETSETFLLVTR